MSACFQKYVGKQGKRKKTEDSDTERAAPTPTTHDTDEVVISDDSNGHGRTDRLKKRRKRNEHVDKDEELVKAEQLIQHDFGIPVDDGMSRQEIIDLATVLLQSKEERAQSPDTDKPRSPKQCSSTTPNRGSTSDDDSLDLNIPNSREQRGKSPILKKPNVSEEDIKNRRGDKSPEPSTSFAVEDGTRTSLRKISRRKVTRGDGEGYKATSLDEVMSRGGTGDAVDDDEKDPPGTRNQRKVASEKRQRKRRLTDEAVGDESHSSQEADSANTRLNKSRNLLLNKHQLETMQAKTSTLLKKSAAKVRLSQESVSSGSQPTQTVEVDTEETQAPGSQELFEGETIPMDLPGTVSDEEADQHKDKTRVLRSEDKVIASEKDSLLSPLIPMKRKYSKAALLRRSHQNESSRRNYYAPVSADHITYTKVIIQLFDIYFRKLTKEQMKTGSYIEWGQSVKAGRHMTRTIDAKGRGQKSYSWSSESDEEVTIRFEKYSDEEVESGESRLQMKSRTGERSLRATKSRKLVHKSSSPDSPKSSGTDVNEHKQIQPRRIIPTRRNPSNEDEESLPDFGISSSDKPPEAGQCRYSEDTMTDSPVFPTLVPQTLAMEEDLYMADTETFEPELTEVQSRDSDSPMEIQPRKTIVNSPAEIQKRETIKRLEDVNKSGNSEFLPRRSLRKSSPSTVTCSQDTRKNSISLSPKLPGSQGSSENRESSSLINSQGEIKSFQKAKSENKMTFDFDIDIDEDDSKDSDVGSFVTKRKHQISPRQTAVGSSMSLSESRTKGDVQDKAGRGKERLTIDIVSSDSEGEVPGKERLSSVHESPILSVRRIGHTFTRKKRASMTTTRQEAMLDDDFFSKDNSDFETDRSGLKVRNLSPNSKPPAVASTSKDRTIPIVLTDTYEKESTSANTSQVKGKNFRSKLHFADSDDSGEVVESGLEIGTEGKIQCPMCSKLFQVNRIERHASDCLGQQEVTSTTGDDAHLQASISTRSSHEEGNKGDYSGITRTVKEQDEAEEQQAPVRVKPIPQSRNMEQCCVCNKLVRQDLIEKHTDQCIADRMRHAAEGGQDVYDLDLEADEPAPRATRSRGRGHQIPSGIQRNVKYRIMEEETDSLSSETSDNHDPNWTSVPTSGVESDSPVKFKKISQLEEVEMDFKNQFKSKSAGRGRKGGPSRGRGRK